MKLFFCLIASLVLISCTTKPKHSTAPFNEKGEVRLALVPKLNDMEITDYHSRGITRVYKNNILEKKSKEDVDFSVSSKVTKVEPLEKRIHMDVKTITKNGEGDLHEFAVPELGETITMVMDDQANVFVAGTYPKDSVFYVPPISLPDMHVKVGESWVLKKNWITKSNRIPLVIDMVTIFKEMISCEKDQNCAVLEVSGDVKIDGPTKAGLNLKSEIKGYLIFSVEQGRVVWSHILNEQTLSAGEVRIYSQSCLITRLQKPVMKKLLDLTTPYCKSEGKLKEIQIPKAI